MTEHNLDAVQADSDLCHERKESALFSSYPWIIISEANGRPESSGISDL